MRRFPTNQRYGYAVLNAMGSNREDGTPSRLPANKKIVFHRVTRSKRTYCNGTNVMDYELHAKCPIDRLSPCKRCYRRKRRARAYHWPVALQQRIEELRAREAKCRTSAPQESR